MVCYSMEHLIFIWGRKKKMMALKQKTRKKGNWFGSPTPCLMPKFDTIVRFFKMFISGAWSMLQVLKLMDFKTAMHGVRGYLVALLVVYARVGAPNLTKTPEDYWKSETITQADWDKIIKDTMAEEFENHIFKVIDLKSYALKREHCKKLFVI